MKRQRKAKNATQTRPAHREIQEIRARMAKSRKAAERGIEKSLLEFRKAVRDAENKLKRLKGTGRMAWKELKKDARAAWRDLKRYARQAAAQLKI